MEAETGLEGAGTGTLAGEAASVGFTAETLAGAGVGAALALAAGGLGAASRFARGGAGFGASGVMGSGLAIAAGLRAGPEFADGANLPVAAVMPGLVFGAGGAGAEIFLAVFLRAGILAMLGKLIS